MFRGEGKFGAAFYLYLSATGASSFDSDVLSGARSAPLRAVFADHARLNPGVLLAFPLKPQCSHSNHARDCRYFQFHVSFPQLGHVSGCEGRGATHLGAATDRERSAGR